MFNCVINTQLPVFGNRFNVDLNLIIHLCAMWCQHFCSCHDAVFIFRFMNINNSDSVELILAYRDRDSCLL